MKRETDRCHGNSSLQFMERLDEAISAKIPFHLIPFPNEVSDESFKSSVHLISDSIQDGPKRRKIKRTGILRFLLLRFERGFAWMDGMALGDGGTPRRMVRSLGYKMIKPLFRAGLLSSTIILPAVGFRDMMGT